MRHCKWFLHHVLTVNQGLTNLQRSQILRLANPVLVIDLRLLAHSRSFLANPKARNAKVGAENLLMLNKSMIICWPQ